jgi:hypothetical protein
VSPIVKVNLTWLGLMVPFLMTVLFELAQAPVSGEAVILQSTELIMILAFAFLVLANEAVLVFRPRKNQIVE